MAVDAGHLKGAWNGVMLTLSCKDSDNKIIHVATAVTPKEDAASYRFLFENAMANQEFAQYLNNAETTIFSDGHKGSSAATKKTVPLAHHRTCLKHIIGGLKEAVGAVR